MKHFTKSHLSMIVAASALSTLLAAPALAQTTTFTYQGRLTDASLVANGSYDFEFRLFDAAGVAIGAAQTREDVQVSNGVFTVELDAALFAANAFDGGSRLLEIAVRRGDETGDFTMLAPRQSVTSAPYAIQSVNATTAMTAQNAQSLDGQPASQFIQTDDARLSDARAPTPGSNFYIQNSTARQASTNFNVSGNGTAGGTLSAATVNAATAYNLGGNRVLSNAGSNNLFAGVGAGLSITTGNINAFFSRDAGRANTTGSQNAFFGALAGLSNTIGGDNAFFGRSAGESNTAGNFNSFYGRSAGGRNTTANGNSFFGANVGQNNTTGDGNSFFGRDAAQANTTGGGNSFFGAQTGLFNTTGGNNAFFGTNAGRNNTTGSNNTMVGTDANVASGNLSFATAIGAGARVSTNNTVVLGRSNDTVCIPGNLVPERGFILRSPGGFCFLLLARDDGSVTGVRTTCP
ncbi:MAG: hypothetical protein ACRD9R_20995 [Pyrinomonadaceae bacterium]